MPRRASRSPDEQPELFASSAAAPEPTPPAFQAASTAAVERVSAFESAADTPRRPDERADDGPRAALLSPPTPSRPNPGERELALDAAEPEPEPSGQLAPPRDETEPAAVTSEPLVIPARMLNEFVYCRRLFYFEFVEGVFVGNEDTARGDAIHERVDSGRGGMPLASRASKRSSRAAEEEASTDADSATEAAAAESTREIRSRSVSLGSERLGVSAKLDLVEMELAADGVVRVCPVDYKAGAPREEADGAGLWDADRMQLGLQCLLLRENGYRCDEGLIYYRATKQRVRLAVTPELEQWVLAQLAEARRVAQGPRPPPLVNSPKCVRCSLAPVCLPDETRLLARLEADAAGEWTATRPRPQAPRRLMAARSDRRALYLNTAGLRVGLSDEVLQVREGDALREQVRLSDLDHVAVFGPIQLTTQAVQELCEQDVPISWFSTGGWYYGQTHGHGQSNVFSRLAQFEIARDPARALPLARAFVAGKIRNQRTLLMRNHSEPPPLTLGRLREAADAAARAGSAEELLGLEGSAASAYFAHFEGMLKVHDPHEGDDLPGLEASTETRARELREEFRFDFRGRNRRPPTDPVNALLSLGYSLLAKECALAARAVGLDPYVGFYHQPRFGRPALSLDLMEEFRPLLAESAVLTAINSRFVTPACFVRAGQAVNLSKEGRRAFFQCFEKRLQSVITHPIFDYKVSYRRAIELQCRLLASVLTGEIDAYPAFLTR